VVSLGFDVRKGPRAITEAGLIGEVAFQSIKKSNQSQSTRGLTGQILRIKSRRLGKDVVEIAFEFDMPGP
jgi:hypothetical protein